MSFDDFFGGYPRAPKRPPPKHGIKIKKAGTTWWGQRWIEALERSSSQYASRLARGRTYARAGRTHDLVVKSGEVRAKVTGSRPQPYTVTIRMAKLKDAAWTAAIAAMSEKAQFAAELLAGQMPKEIDDAFRSGKQSLFVARAADLDTACSCPDWANPCKHVAATHYVLGEALDRDPFLLFELRGRTKDQVLAALRAARGAAPERAGEPEIARVTLGELTRADYDAPRAALPALDLSFDEPAVPGALLRQLGAPSAWRSGASPVELLAPAVRAAADRARRIALGAGAGEPPAEETAAAAMAPRRVAGSARPAGQDAKPKKKRASKARTGH